MQKLIALLTLTFLLASTSSLKIERQFRVESEILESNDLGEIVIQYVHQILDSMEDPLLLVSNLTVPIFINDTLHLDGDVNVTDVYLTNFKNINFTDCIVTFTPPNAAARIGVRIPYVVAYGDYAMDLFLTSLFPIPLQGEGPFSLELSEIQFDADVQLEALPDGEHFHIIYMSFEVDLYKIWFRIDGLFTGVDDGELNEAVNKVINAYATILFNLFEAEYHEDVLAIAVQLINEFLLTWPQ